jgi:putative endopeptidase
MYVKRYVVALLIAMPLATILARAQAADRKPTTASASGVQLTALDRDSDPCTDFYQFACGGWVASNPLPNDRRSYGRFGELQDKNFALLRRVLEGRNAGSRDLAKARAYYAACTDENAIEKKGIAALAPELARIDALARAGDLPPLVGRLHADDGEAPGTGGAVGTAPYVFFTFLGRQDFTDATKQIAVVGPAGLSLPNRDYYAKTDTRSADLRLQFRTTVERIMTLAGEPADRAARDAESVLTIESALASHAMDVAARRDPHARNHPMRVADLQALTPSFEWRRYFTAAGAPPFDTINVDEPEFMKGVESVVATTPLDAIKAYLRWHVVHASVNMLPKAIADTDFDFFSRRLAGQQAQQPRWRRCITQTDQHLGEALGQAFVEETFGPRAKADTLAMVQGIKAALARDIKSLSWMTPETKAAALQKLAGVVDRIGYPDKWRDYSTIQVSREDALGNLQRVREFERARAVKRIGRPVDKNDWNMTPQTVNAYYSPPNNNINFPAGILQPPFYQADRDAAVNYGGAGAVIGHELTHGFDDQGRKYDAQGDLRDWWTPTDGKAFEERVSCVADQYSSYVVAGDTHINGRLTLGENTADNGGLRLALMAYLAGPGATPQPTLDGFTPEQRVFLGWAQVWCENARPESERLQAQTNPHSAARYRVNGPVSNMPEFQQAFSCKADAPMVRPNACRVW